jgi:hypothetical protein
MKRYLYTIILFFCLYTSLEAIQWKSGRITPEEGELFYYMLEDIGVHPKRGQHLYLTHYRQSDHFELIQGGWFVFKYEDLPILFNQATPIIYKP